MCGQCHKQSTENGHFAVTMTNSGGQSFDTFWLESVYRCFFWQLKGICNGTPSRAPTVVGGKNYQFCSVYNVYTMYIQCLYNVYTMSIQCIYNVYTMYIQCLYNVYKMSIQCIYNVYTMYIQCLYSVYTMYIQCLYNVYTMSIQYIYNVSCKIRYRNSIASSNDTYLVNLKMA
jgi:hypothetical protein